MKSKICLCNGTTLKKDLTRFAPLMLVTGLALWGFGTILRTMEEYLLPEEMPEASSLGLFLAVFLGLFSAITLFTYLTKKKECDYVHALPLRRETLFATKLLAALIQFAVPFGIFYIFFPGNRGWVFQMAVTFCAWLFTFGVAVFAMILAGRRIAAFILFSLIIDLASSVYSVVQSVYLPLLPGVYLGGVLMDLSPFTHILSLNFEGNAMKDILLPMGGYALLGIGFLAAALVFYRRRKLERAGDFLAVKWLEPVLAWSLGVYIAMFTVGLAMLIDGNIWLGLVIGLTIGYFAARMFFARSIKVFGKKNLLSYGALVAVMAATIFVTSLDPLGLVQRIPTAEQIESVTLYDYTYGLYEEEYFLELADSNGYKTTEAEEVERLRSLHAKLIPLAQEAEDSIFESAHRFYLVYDLKNGSQVKRCYDVQTQPELAELGYFLSQPENQLGTANLEELLDQVTELSAYGGFSAGTSTIHTRRSFLQVFLKDCEAGLMYAADSDELSDWMLSIELNVDGWVRYVHVDIPLAAKDTIAWLEDYFQ